MHTRLIADSPRSSRRIMIRSRGRSVCGEENSETLPSATRRGGGRFCRNSQAPTRVLPHNAAIARKIVRRVCMGRKSTPESHRQREYLPRTCFFLIIKDFLFHVDKLSMSKSIFVVDDDPIIRILVSDYLEARGYQVSALESAKACIERLFCERPDLLLVDMQMPEMNGAELLQVLRNTPEYSALPVVILSAGSDVQNFTENNYHVRADDYLANRLTCRRLLESLKGSLRNRSSKAVLSSKFNSAYQKSF